MDKIGKIAKFVAALAHQLLTLGDVSQGVRRQIRGSLARKAEFEFQSCEALECTIMQPLRDAATVFVLDLQQASEIVAALNLKFVLHHGDYVLQRIVGREELAGPEVIVAHRLLKNHARDVVGMHPYALMTDAALAALEVPVGDKAGDTETYDGLPPIPAHLLVLD